MRTKLLYQTAPVWQVGEDRPAGADRKQLAVDHERLRASEHYPNDYPGRVISVIPATAEYFPADMADPHRRVIELDPNEEELQALRGKRLKVGGYGLEDVTFDDRWGAVGEALRAKHADPEGFEREEAAAVEAAEAANQAERELFELERLAFEMALKDYARDLVAFHMIEGLDEEAPVAPTRPKGPVLIERRDAFLEQATDITRGLAKTITHTGAGLYKVQAAGTMATPAHLWAMETVDPTDDGTPGGNAGTGTNVTVVGGEIGSALDFNGNDSNVNVGDVTALNAVEKFTICCRMNQDVLDTFDQIFIKYFGALQRIEIKTLGGLMYFIVENGGTGYASFDYSTAIAALAWHSVIMVFDGTQTGNANRLKVYVDGIPITLSFNGTIPATTYDLAGNDALIGNTSNSFDGTLDDFRIYDDALTDAQAKVIAGRGLAHWDTISAFDANACLYSEQFDNAWWTLAGSASITDTDAIAAPNDKTTADIIVIAGSVNSQIYSAPIGGAGQYTLSLYVKVASGTAPFRFRTWSAADTTQDGPDETATTTWQRFTFTVNVTVATQVYFAVDSGNTGGTFHIWGFQYELAGAASAYKPTRSATDTSVTLTTGGLTDGDRDGEVFVSGGNAYAVVRNGTDSVLVIGDATGESGACSISPYSQIQSAFDQLWADQGAATFTASQYIRVFAGTYDEAVAPNTSFDPHEHNGYPCILEGDPADDRANIIIATTAGAYDFYAKDHGYLLRHLRFAGTPSTYLVRFDLSYTHQLVHDCEFEGGKVLFYFGVGGYSSVLFRDCSFTETANAICIAGAAGLGVRCENCTFLGPGKANIGATAIYTPGAVDVMGCTFRECHEVTGNAEGSTIQPIHRIINCTIYSCFCAVASSLYNANVRMLNCIVSECDYVFNTERGGWVQETATQFRNEWVLRNNYYYNYGTFSHENTLVEQKTYAEFMALNGIDMSGDVDGVDPLLTDPGADDYSLQTASPCRNAGHGTGAIEGVNAVAFDAHHPDIGAWSSGALTVGAITITQVVQLTNSSARVTLTTENGLDVIAVRYRLATDDVWTLFGSTRTGSGTLDITGLTLAEYVFIATAVRCAEASVPSNAMSLTLVDGSSIDVETALYSILTGNATLTALTGLRIYPQEAPQGVTSPYVTYTRVDSQHYHNMKGASGLVESRVQIDAWAQPRNAARPYDEVKAVAEAVRLALDGYAGTVSVGGGSITIQSILLASETDGYIPPVAGGERGTERVTVDYMVVHDESVPTF